MVASPRNQVPQCARARPSCRALSIRAALQQQNQARMACPQFRRRAIYSAKGGQLGDSAATILRCNKQDRCDIKRRAVNHGCADRGRGIGLRDLIRRFSLRGQGVGRD